MQYTYISVLALVSVHLHISNSSFTPLPLQMKHAFSAVKMLIKRKRYGMEIPHQKRKTQTKQELFFVRYCTSLVWQWHSDVYTHYSIHNLQEIHNTVLLEYVS